VTKEYRERHEIIAHILSTINDRGTEGASRTMIMYNFFLSYAKLKEYLSFLIERGLVDEFPQQFERSGIKNICIQNYGKRTSVLPDISRN
jgi:predicted transcriptional regulator